VRKAAVFALLLTVVTNTAVAPMSASHKNEHRVIGTSVQGRPIEATRFGTPGGTVVVVVGVIHGDEDAGLLITKALSQSTIPRGIDLWLVPTINPDGTALGWRTNANQVDLNRNFPYAWSKIGRPGYWQYAGNRRASEPETKAIIKFLREIKPDLGIWYHQNLNIISPGTGLEGKLRERYSQLTDTPLKRITGGRYTGVAVTWQRNTFTSGYGFVVELGSSLSIEQASLHAAAVLQTAILLRDS